MTKAVKAGVPKLKIEESATKKQAKVDSGSRFVVGVNKFKNPKEPKVDVRVIDNNRVRDDQIKKINDIKASRDQKAVDESLAKLVTAAKEDSNLLACSIDAIKNRVVSLGLSNDKYKVDVLWDGEESHPTKWLPYAIDIEDEGIHYFHDYPYLENKF